VSVLALAAIVLMVNFLSARHHHRAVWNPDSRHSLSPLTRQFLGSLTNQVRIAVLFDPVESSLFPEVRAILEEYVAACPRLEVEYVNYGRSKGRADDLLAQYQVAPGTDTLLVIFDAAGRAPRVVREKELTEYDMSAAMRNEPIRRIGFKGEQFFTSALVALADGRPLRAYALTGHGEVKFEDADAIDGYGAFTAMLREKNIELHPLSLRTENVPADCELLVIAGPRYSVPPDELDKIDRYLQSGGRALVLLLSTARSGTRRTGIETVLADWGVEVLPGAVIDEAQSQAGDTKLLLADRFGPHPVSRPLAGARLAMILPLAIMPRNADGETGEGAKVQPLVLTTERGMLVTPASGGRGLVETNGVLPVAVAVERGGLADVSPDRGVTRLVVVGAASTLENQLIDLEANRDFGGLAVNWLLDRQQLQNVGPKKMHEYQINLTTAQLHGAAWVLLGALPGTVLVIGLLVWMRRRR